jgi:UDP-2,4-diacetamido-2,4,6-trideoxy-beta-L-altropyranose hydrolase
MTVVFRVDASTRMGTGHVMRCLTLAESLRARGAQTWFVSRTQAGDLITLVRNRGLDVRVLPAPPPEPSEAADIYATWLGVPELTDATETLAALRSDKPDWLVVDHYGLGARWEQQLRPHVGRLLVIDDLANRPHDCDVLLDPNHWRDPDGRHAGLVPEGCQVLVGAPYVLLGPEYARHRHAARVRDGIVRRVLVYFGGSDPDDMTRMVLGVLSMPPFQHLDVDIVVGPNNLNADTIRAEAAGRKRTMVHSPRAHLADLMAQADLAVGAGGVASWERCCLGLPALVICIADNQRPTCEALSAAGLIHYVGESTSVGPTDIEMALRSLVSDRDRMVALSALSARLIDGRGAARVADIITGGGPTVSASSTDHEDSRDF